MSFENPDNEYELQTKVICKDLWYDTPEKIPNEKVIEWITQYARKFRDALNTTSNTRNTEQKINQIIILIHQEWTYEKPQN